MKNILKQTLILATIGLTLNCGGVSVSNSDPEPDPDEICLASGTTIGNTTDDAIHYGGCALPSPDLSLSFSESGDTVWSLYVIQDDTYGWLIGAASDTYYVMSDEDAANLLSRTGDSDFSDFLTDCDAEAAGSEVYAYSVYSDELGVSEDLSSSRYYCLDDNENSDFVEFLTEVADRTIPLDIDI